MQATAQAIYAWIISEIPAFGQWTQEQFIEAYAMVLSRSTRGKVYDNDEGKVPTLCLVPFGDMVNHRAGAPTHYYYDSEAGGFALDATDDIPNGAEICRDYGQF